MSELRWILLVAGLALIAGVYLWGTRSGRRSATANVERPVRPEPPAASADARPAEPARLEPSVSVEEATADFGTPRLDEDAFDTPPALRGVTSSRREPTFGTRVDAPQEIRARPAAIPPRAPESIPVAEPEPPPLAAPAPGTPAVPAAESKPAPSRTRAPQKIVAIRVNAGTSARIDGARLLECLRAEALEFGRYEIFHRLHSDGRPIFSVANLREPGTFDPATMPGASFPGVALFTVLPGPVPGTEAFDQLIFAARALAAQLNGALADERGGPLTVHRITRLREEVVEFERQHTPDGGH